MKIGLVLEGGAMRGMFTAGVLDVLLDEQIAVLLARYLELTIQLNSVGVYYATT